VAPDKVGPRWLERTERPKQIRQHKRKTFLRDGNDRFASSGDTGRSEAVLTAAPQHTQKGKPPPACKHHTGHTDNRMYRCSVTLNGGGNCKSIHLTTISILCTCWLRKCRAASVRNLWVVNGCTMVRRRRLSQRLSPYGNGLTAGVCVVDLPLKLLRRFWARWPFSSRHSERGLACWSLLFESRLAVPGAMIRAHSACSLRAASNTQPQSKAARPAKRPRKG